MNLPNLRIALDTTEPYDRYLRGRFGREELNWQREKTKYENIIETIVENGKFGTLKGLWCFGARSDDDEARMEKRILGEAYDSLKDGKLKRHDRDAFSPLEKREDHFCPFDGHETGQLGMKRRSP